MEKSTKTKNKLEDAYRHIANSKQNLRKAGLRNDEYLDNKYVRTAGDVAWKGVMLAIDYLLEYFEIKFQVTGNKRFSIKTYQAALSQLREKKGKRYQYFLSKFMILYKGFHLSMGYDGLLYKQAIDTFYQLADEYFTRIKKVIQQK